jgi:hypothetical protein
VGYSGASNTGAADVLLYGGQYETGSYATSYIPTAGASANRVADVANFTLPGAVTTSVGSWAYSFFSPSPVSSIAGLTLGAGTLGSSLTVLDNVRTAIYDQTTLTQQAGITDMTNRLVRVAGSWTGSTQKIFTDALSTSGSFDGTMISSTTMYLGGYSTGTSAPSVVISRVCADGAESRCR